MRNDKKGISRARVVSRVAVVALVCVGLATTVGIGSPSAFGIGQFFLLCPLGGLEVLLASKTLIPQALLSMAVVVLFALVFGRSWCAWGCPAKVVRPLFGKKEEHRVGAACAASLKETFKRDSRLWVLGGVLVATLVVGFPVFCLVCPIGLSVGTIVSVWRLIQFNEVGLSLVVFPLALVIEMVAIKRWCVSFCPVAGLLSLFGRVARVGRPRVDASVCARCHGGSCGACEAACPEGISLHAPDAAAQLADCTRCGLCVEACPSSAVSLKAHLSRDAVGQVNNQAVEQMPAKGISSDAKEARID